MHDTKKATNITWHATKVGPEQRRGITRVRPAVLWLTGLSGCGKSTIGMALEAALIERGHLAFVLDGDNVRHGLNKNLGFSDGDRTENIRRIGEVAKLFVQAGVMAITSFISPFRADRKGVRGLMGEGEFVEIFIDAPLDVCESRDPKGLYKKARAAIAEGKGLQFTGLDSPYEAPERPELHVRTDKQTVEESVVQILEYLEQRGHLLK
ncbi:MAG TPA: adenylyl-sulfate kinase [Phycisphaerae bacterium]|nr:adenylyl-sulfate kinase [Phycisphaerae bacterium]